MVKGVGAILGQVESFTSLAKSLAEPGSLKAEEDLVVQLGRIYEDLQLTDFTILGLLLSSKQSGHLWEYGFYLAQVCEVVDLKAKGDLKEIPGVRLRY